MLINDKEFNVLTSNKIFYKGVIEDNNDPLKIGRLKVRILGVHDSNKKLVPTSTLPWATINKSLDFGGFQSGIGISSVPTKGTWVWLFFDNNDVSSPVVIGAIPGITKTKQLGSGFSDPDGVYPKDGYLGKSDFNTINTSSYLNNHVIQTPGGQLIEMNDGGHIKITHTSGTYIEMSVDGKLSISTANDTNINVTGNTTLNSSGDLTITAPNTTINSNVVINGSTGMNGNATVSGTTTSGGINLNTHIHPGDSGGITGQPQN